jgi:hypothetical protein
MTNRLSVSQSPYLKLNITGFLIVNFPFFFLLKVTNAKLKSKFHQSTSLKTKNTKYICFLSVKLEKKLSSQLYKEVILFHEGKKQIFSD